MTNTHKKRLIGKDDEMDRDVIGKKIPRNEGMWKSGYFPLKLFN